MSPRALPRPPPGGRPGCSLLCHFLSRVLSLVHRLLPSFPAVAGAWTVWEAWGPCSVSCGGGHRSRQRRCMDPPPKNGGAPCPGAPQERAPCSLQPCTGGTGKGSGVRPWGCHWASWGPPPPRSHLPPDCGPGRVHVSAELCRRGLAPPCPPSCLDPEAKGSCGGRCLEGEASPASGGAGDRALRGAWGTRPGPPALASSLPSLRPEAGAERTPPRPPGCRCPPELLLHGARCLPLAQCPCLVGGEPKPPGLPFLLDNCSRW